MICVWNGTDAQALALLITLNDFNPGMKFTLENVGDHLNYLDLSITLIEVSNYPQGSFGIFRKNSFSGVPIHSDSLHPANNKMATVNAAINRLINLPLSTATTEEEIRHSEDIAVLSGLDINVRTLIKHRKLRRLLSDSSNSTAQRGKHTWLRLPFLGRGSYKTMLHYNSPKLCFTS